MVSVIIPVYNGKETVEQAINSVISQSYTELEIIVVDDGSTDGTTELVENLSKSDSRIIVVHQKNKGQSSARNKGISIAKGKYIQFLDCDDTIEKNAIELLVDTIETHPLADFVLYGFNIYSGKKLLRTPNPGDGYFKSGDSYAIFKKSENLMVSVCDKMYKSEYIKTPFDGNMVYGEDALFNYQNLSKATSFVTIKDCLYNVQLNSEDSVNKRYKQGKLLNQLFIISYIEEKMKSLFQEDFQVIEYRRSEIASVLFSIYSCCIKLNKNDAALELSSIIDNSYLQCLFALKQDCRIDHEILLTLLQKKKVKSVIYICKVLRLIRKLCN